MAFSTNFLFSSILFLSSWVFLGYSRGLNEVTGGVGNVGPLDGLPCLQKIAPCEPYLKNLSGTPPAACCGPMAGLVVNDPMCLCKVINDRFFLKYYNVTFEQALKLPEACDAKPDLSKCKKVAASPSGTPTMPSNATDEGDISPCVKLLVPCQPYLKNPTGAPSTCCGPLAGMVANDPDCICKLVNNQYLLKSFNVTFEQVIKLPEECGAKPDLGKCKKVAVSPSGTPTGPTPTKPSSPATANSSTGGTSSDAQGISLFQGYGVVVALFMSFFLSAVASL